MTFFLVVLVLSGVPILFSGGRSMGLSPSPFFQEWTAPASIPVAFFLPMMTVRIGRNLESGIHDDVLLVSSFVAAIIIFIIGFVIGARKS